MANEDYIKAYKSAANELEHLLVEEAQIEDRILNLRKTMNVLHTLCEHHGLNTTEMDKHYASLIKTIDGSVTSDILKIVSSARRPLTTSEVRDELNKLGGSMAEHSNPLATINAVLNRLTEQGKVLERVKDGRKAWERKPSWVTRAPNPPHQV